MSEASAYEAAGVEIDLALLDEARQLLERVGFTVNKAELSPARLPWLLAENDLFAVGIAAARTLEDLLKLEAYATFALSDRIKEAGAKRWDAYLVLLASEDREARGRREVRNLQYDTHMFRRVVNLGVSADEESVRRALRPFLPLPSPSEQMLPPALSDLVDELVLQGIDRNQALEAVHDYQEREAGL